MFVLFAELPFAHPSDGHEEELLRNSPHPHISLPWPSKHLAEDLGGLCPPAPGLHTQMDFRDASKGAGEEWSNRGEIRKLWGHS